MRKKIIIIPIIFILTIVTFIFYYFKNEEVSAWNVSINQVKIESTQDQTLQDAYFISSTSEQPLLVSLHQWSADYDNFDPLSEYALNADWNYIRPNFRGPNNNPEACGSDLVISDIDDAINYAIENGNVDQGQIYIIGASGGGHAALMHLMKSDYKIHTYSAWVPISDLVAWYGESKVRDNRYYDDILACTSSENDLNITEALQRSPLHQDTPLEKVSTTKINLFAGINDGYDGSVPISHSIDFYNKLIDDLGYDENLKVADYDRDEMLYTQNLVESQSEETLGDRDILYQRKAENIELKIFDGDHEILEKEAFKLLLENKHAQ